MFHVVGVAGGDGFPGVAGGVGGGFAEGGQEPVLAVGAVVGERLTGPFAGDQDAASGVAEVLAAMGLVDLCRIRHRRAYADPAAMPIQDRGAGAARAGFGWWRVSA